MSTTDQDLRALAMGYKAMLEDVVGTLLYIADETPGQSECVAAAEKTLCELGIREER